MPKSWNPFRERLIQALTIGAGGWAIFALRCLCVLNFPLAALGAFEGALLAGLLAALKRNDSARDAFLLNTALTSALLALAVTAADTGGAQSPALWFTCLVPLCAGAEARSRRFIAWTGATALTIVLLHVSFGNGFLWNVAVGQIAVAVLVAWLTSLQWQIVDRHLGDIEQRNRLAQARSDALRSAHAEAVAAVEAKSRFLATMSHEVRTPLNGMLATASALRYTELDPEQREMVGVVCSSGELLLSILNDILDLSKLESGKLKFEKVSFSLLQLVRGAVGVFERQAADKQLELKLNVLGSSGHRLGDQIRIRQILVNLISNAIKFTDTGSVTVTVDCQGDDVSLKVTDTGIGIPAEHFPALFKPFNQVDHTTTRRYGGSGLGLAISQKLAIDMSGSLTVASQSGLGTTFTLKLTLPTVSSGGLDIPLSAPRPALKTQATAGLRVLVVDDNPVNLRVAQSLLRKLGCTYTLARSGQEAVDEAGGQPFDVVLMDVHMPEMDGAEATRRIRNMSLQPQPQILALTADVLPEQAARMREAGADGFLYKPFTIEMLQKILQEGAKRPVATR